MNPTIFPPAVGKILGQTELFNLGMITSLDLEDFREMGSAGLFLPNTHAMLLAPPPPQP